MPYLIIYYEKSLGMSDYVFIMLYLQGQTLQKVTKEGNVLMKYQNKSIGFAKSIKGRINNKYPKGLRKSNLNY